MPVAAISDGGASVRVASFADTTLGAVVFNIETQGRGPLSDDLVASALRRKESATARQEYIDGAFNYLTAHHWPLVVHEWGHILQALASPAVYLRCARELVLTVGLLSNLRNSAQPVGLRTQLQQDWRSLLYGPTTLIYRIGVRENGLSLERGDPQDRRPNDITETDVLEEEISIFQYKVEIDAEGTGAGYGRWLQERGRYTMVFKFLARLLGPESAYVALPALARVAFSTTWPVNTFATLLARTVGHDATLPESLGLDGYLDVMRAEAEATLPRARPGPASAFDEENGLIESEAFRDLVDSYRPHPLRPLRQALVADEREDFPASVLLHPHAYFDRRAQAPTDDELWKLWPPMTIIRLIDPRLRVTDGILSVAPALMTAESTFIDGMTNPRYLTELFKQKQLTFSLAGLLDDQPPYCPHSACPIYPTGVCKAWMELPDDYAHCSFPEWLRWTAYRSVDPGRETLEFVNGGDE